MSSETLVISRRMLRRFTLGRQGLWPARRWRGESGVLTALRADCVVQVDPLNVIARSHDIALYGRVLDYRPEWLDRLLYHERRLFDYGGTVVVHPMEELPYWRVVMARKQRQPRQAAFAAAHQATLDEVLDEVRRRGPLGTADFGGARAAAGAPGTFRSAKIAGQALYWLWLAGEVMTHSRRGWERRYDLRDRVATAAFHHAAPESEADEYFARKAFRVLGLPSARSWRNWYAGAIERRVAPEEAAQRLAALRREGAIYQVAVEGERELRFVAAPDAPALEAVRAGRIPDGWRPAEASAESEMVFLAPLEVVSARGRAKALFDFDYVWEVYKPAQQRRWGYYTLPVLYGDHLVARLDPRLDRATGTLEIKGFWLEDGVVPDAPFVRALRAALRRFLAFAGARRLEAPAALRELLPDRPDRPDQADL